MLRTLFGSLGRRVKRPVEKRNRFRARVEQLEDRCVPAPLGGLYSIDFTAADPTRYTHVFEGDVNCPSRRGNNPIVGADYGDPNVPVDPPRVSVTSLAPAQMTLGQIVPFEILVTMDSSGTTDDTTVTFTATWQTKTTKGHNFGYDPDFGVLCAFVDLGDTATNEIGSDATAEVEWSILGAGTKNERIEGVFTVEDVDPGATIVVEAWLVLDSTIPAKVSGNVQSTLVSAAAQDGSKINTGSQTVPLLKVQLFA